MAMVEAEEAVIIPIGTNPIIYLPKYLERIDRIFSAMNQPTKDPVEREATNSLTGCRNF